MSIQIDRAELRQRLIDLGDVSIELSEYQQLCYSGLAVLGFESYADLPCEWIPLVMDILAHDDLIEYAQEDPELWPWQLGMRMEYWGDCDATDYFRMVEPYIDCRKNRLYEVVLFSLYGRHVPSDPQYYYHLLTKPSLTSDHKALILGVIASYENHAALSLLEKIRDDFADDQDIISTFEQSHRIENLRDKLRNAGV